MKKYILSAILIGNSALLMSQNLVQTNILSNQSNVNISNGRNWFFNESNTNKNIQNSTINVQSRTSTQRNNSIVVNHNQEKRNIQQNIARNTNRTQAENRNAIRNTNEPIQIQRNVNINEDVYINLDDNIGNQYRMNENNPVFNNGNMKVNMEPVQAKQIQFLADNNKSNIQLSKPELNFSLEFNQQIKVKTEKVKTEKIKVSVSESGSEKIKVNSVISSNIKTEKSISTVKHKGGSSYSQKNKSYMGKKIKIWCKKNLKFVKKIRAKVSCPKF